MCMHLYPGPRNNTICIRSHFAGPDVIDTISQLGTTIGGAEWNVGLSLIHLNTSQDTVALALYAHNVLGNDLTSFLLGNEPDLYLGGGKRPGMANYTVPNYVRERRCFDTVSSAECGITPNLMAS